MVAVRQRWDAPRVRAGFQQRTVKVSLEENVDTDGGQWVLHQPTSQYQISFSVTLAGFAVSEEK